MVFLLTRWHWLNSVGDARSVVALLVGIEPDENPKRGPTRRPRAGLGGDGLVQVGGATHPPGQLHAGRMAPPKALLPAPCLGTRFRR